MHRLLARSKSVPPEIRTVEDYGGSVIDLLQTKKQQTEVREIVKKLVKISPTLKGMDSEIIYHGIFSRVVPLRRAEKGEVIMSEGEGNCTNFFVLAQGRIAVVRGGRTIAILENNGSFGTMAFLSGGTRNSSIITESSAVTLEIGERFVTHLPLGEQILLYKNIACEFGNIVTAHNEEQVKKIGIEGAQILDKSKIDQGALVDLSRAPVEQQNACRKIIEKLVKISPPIKGMDSEILHRSVIDGSIPVRKIEEGKIALHEGRGNNRHFFILARGDVSIVRANKVIAKMGNSGSFGTMTFLSGIPYNHNSIVTDTESVTLEISEEFIASLPLKQQVLLYKNIALEFSSIIAKNNEKLTPEQHIDATKTAVNEQLR